MAAIKTAAQVALNGALHDFVDPASRGDFRRIGPEMSRVKFSVRNMESLKSAIVAAAVLIAGAAVASECPENPDAIGTSRTIVVEPVEHPELGSLQYRESLPLEYHEVVLTFDDGPLPPKTNHVLDTLAHECVKATFFLVGEMAMNYPDVVRRIKAAGHTIGTHTQSHPYWFHKEAEQEIGKGIISVTSVLGELPAPFFRVPGLRRTNTMERYLAAEHLMTWSADFLADDWTSISAAQVYARALRRIEANGKGILLLHDIQARTAEALPHLLHELKRRGYHIVHVVPAMPDRPKTATVPSQWITASHARPASFADTNATVLALPESETGQSSSAAPSEPLGYLGNAETTRGPPRKARTAVKCSLLHILWINHCS
jgi:peptidoglycan/xylan/chitin deacetylase (PgdA/CDA1 family)